jgi:hypothetical protein
MYARLDMANWLHEGYLKAKEHPEAVASQKTLVLEIISKWIQLLEDLAILCLMFAGSDIKYQGSPIVNLGKLPYEIYVFVENQSILQFYTVAKKGFSKKTMAKIYGYKTADELLKEGLINKAEHSYFRSEIEKLYVAATDNLNKLGGIYSARKKYKGKQAYGKLVETYFKTKHGFKVLHPTETTKILWNFNDTDIALVKGIAHTKSGRKVMTLGLYKEFDEAGVSMLLERIKDWSEVMQEIVGAQLRKLDNPNYLVPMIRKIKTEELLKQGAKKPGRNDPCICASGLKYKKCCGN